MISKIIIAASDDDIRRIIQKDFSSKVGENNVQVCGNHNELNSLCKYAQDTAVIFDKYFLGYVVSYELIRLKTINPKLLIYFTEIGRMSETFATRVCQYKVDGYICDVEDSAHLQNQIMQIEIRSENWKKLVSRKNGYSLWEQRDAYKRPTGCYKVKKRADGDVMYYVRKASD